MAVCVPRTRTGVIRVALSRSQPRFHAISELCHGVTLTVRGHKYVLGPTPTHFGPSPYINCITIVITLEGIEEIKTEKKKKK